ncbi:hypothetical protein [Paenarthrobacter sp. PH39-S1]|uniref:hypothetical protein n=1 Tax=Paenarthrobacter sp. PH39-S1 TaxID=3046204 RepID=UPI0024BAF8F9|nr:hypothetical protein [Paenarthrobacter sp. PH39-S1]MDJ0357957.1 hypothetical protein [Paenarthrobacter sp. PH39-S1]
MKAHYSGEIVAITEPVPLTSLQPAGLVNETPADYSRAIEASQDVPISVMKDTLDLIPARSVKFLIYNNQTEGPQTLAIQDAAAGVLECKILVLSAEITLSSNFSLFTSPHNDPRRSAWLAPR